MQKIIKERQEEIFQFYKLRMMGECPDVVGTSSKQMAQKLRWLLAECNLSCDESSFYALIMRVFDLNTTLLKTECERQKVSEKAIRCKIDEFLHNFYKNHHAKTITLLKQKSDEFKCALLDLVHEIGLQLNLCAPRWLEQVEKNAEFFKKLENPFEYINSHKLYFLTEDNQRADRIYALCTNLGTEQEKMLCYAEYFEKEFRQIDEIFKNFFKKIENLEKDEQICAWVNYLKALRAAFANKSPRTNAWAEAERAWMQVKDSWQIGHFLEYYEDNYTHAVALEWDLRINLNSCMDESTFKDKMSSSMQRIYLRAAVDNPAAQDAMQANLERAQIYICAPILYYGAAMNGLFSAQVVPNDETVSKECGKKIFAFVDFVRAKALNKPKTKLNDYVFSKQLRDFNQSVLENEKLFKKVYEHLTIGHEGGHLFFIDSNTEMLMNASGMFKNIEEFKASAGGLFNYLYENGLRGNVKTQLDQAILANITMRAINLLAYKNEQEIEPYYVEALIFLKILKDAGCVKFNTQPSEDAPLVQLEFDKFEEFKKLFCEAYLQLAKLYLRKEDAINFLNRYAIKRDKFESTDEQIALAQEIYAQLYAKYASVKKEEK